MVNIKNYTQGWAYLDQISCLCSYTRHGSLASVQSGKISGSAAETSRRISSGRGRGRFSAFSAEDDKEGGSISESAAEKKIKEAHRRAMLANHPDAAGSNYLATKINEAKDIMMGKT